ncbi:MAG: UDP-N-acetylmuramoyl-L-alanyl-D-glutamate--2,6-diaminopimelate ligase [Chloroflexota bacterium]
MKFGKLLSALPAKTVIGKTRNLEIEAIAFDSRQVKPGAVFVAIPGTQQDGRDYVPQAIENGAVAVVLEEPVSRDDVVQVVVPSARQALAWLASAFYGYPGRRMRVIGITGTDGKTTTCNILGSILRTAGHNIGMVTTVNAEIGNRHLDTGLHTTTPSALEVQQYLREMLDAGARYAIIETTSHALDQERTLGSEYDVAVVTNVTHEHLDYHGTYEAYLASKGKLFASLSASYRKRGIKKVSVLNADDQSFEYLRQFPADLTLTYGQSRGVDIWASDVRLTPKGTSFTAHTPSGQIAIESYLPGTFNVYNILAAVAAAVSQDVSASDIEAGVAAVKRIVGRMDPVDLGQDFDVVIDFAHTPNGLEQALKLGRTLTGGKLTVVFGSAGLRDREKRPMMGEVAGRLADFIVITAEDPRTEDLNAIMEHIAAGCRSAGRREGIDFWKIGDRAKAIAFAIRQAAPGDLVLITGKGHEKSMCFGDREYPWSDHEAATRALEARLKETRG